MELISKFKYVLCPKLFVLYCRNPNICNFVPQKTVKKTSVTKCHKLYRVFKGPSRTEEDYQEQKFVTYEARG